MSLTSKILAATAACAMLGACASTEDANEANARADDPRRGAEVDRVCFTSSIDGFGETTRDTVVVREGVNDYYLVEVFGGCYNLRNAQSLAFDTFSGCLTRGDSLIAYTSAFGPDPMDTPNVKCRINNIYKWDPDATEEAGEDEIEEIKSGVY